MSLFLDCFLVDMDFSRKNYKVFTRWDFYIIFLINFSFTKQQIN